MRKLIILLMFLMPVSTSAVTRHILDVATFSKDSGGNKATTLNGDLGVDTNTLFVDSSSNRVGIGLTNPTDELEVSGNIKLSGSLWKTNLSSYYLDLQTGGNKAQLNGLSGVDLSTGVGNTVGLALNSSSHVGIGTSSPDHNLHVGESANNISLVVERTGSNPSIIAINADTNEPNIKFTPNAATRRGLSIKNSSGVTLTKFYDAEEQVVFPTGNVGIGDITPDYLLDVAGTANIEADLFVDNKLGLGTESPVTLFNINQDTNNNAIHINTDDTGSGASDGSSIFVEQASMDLIINERENADVCFFINGSERVTFQSDGYVGVGDTTPDYLLDVAGTANIIFI